MDQLIAKVKKWGSDQPAISYILQMDTDSDLQTDRSNSLKLLIVAQRIKDFLEQPAWLEDFGAYTKCHKANHGFFQILKVSYTCGVNVNFVMVEGNGKETAYNFGDADDLENNLNILVNKGEK
ncbi:hypothetical protein [Maribacter aestuarii]|uniref:hypothetical protein n=1 Tax=Maribacter aestuarii TaxID=1130723 RepID=UPI00248C816F|nr:hypothetical protein [Maribacter aestuarii]